MRMASIFWRMLIKEFGWRDLKDAGVESLSWESTCNLTSSYSCRSAVVNSTSSRKLWIGGNWITSFGRRSRRQLAIFFNRWTAFSALPDFHKLEMSASKCLFSEYGWTRRNFNRAERSDSLFCMGVPVTAHLETESRLHMARESCELLFRM